MSTNSPRRRKRHTPRHATARSSLLRRVLLLSSILVFAGQVTTVVVATVGAFTIPTPITRTVNQLITTRLSLFQYNSAFHRSSHDHSANKPTPRRGRVVSILSTKCSPRNHCRAATRWPQLSRVQRRASSWGEILHGVIINPLQVGGVSISMMSTLPRLTCYHGDDSSWTARSIRSRRAVTTSYKYALSSRAHLWALCGSRLFCSAPAEGTQESGSGGDGGGEERALLLRMDFEHADIEELRRWIRRSGREWYGRAEFGPISRCTVPDTPNPLRALEMSHIVPYANASLFLQKQEK